MLLVATTGCATPFSSSTSDVALTSNPTGAAVCIDGNRSGETPTIIELEKNKSYTVVFRWSDGGDARRAASTARSAARIRFTDTATLVAAVRDRGAGGLGDWAEYNGERYT